MHRRLALPLGQQRQIVAIDYAVGWDWPTYRGICVDDVPASSTPNPITYGFSIP